MSKSQLAEFSQEVAEEQARLVDPLRWRAPSLKMWRLRLLLWARLCVYISGRITPLLRSYLDEKYPEFAQTVTSEPSTELNDPQFWQLLRKWIDTYAWARARAEGWHHALADYTAANSAYKKANDRGLKTKRALEDGALTEIPLYEFWRDEEQEV